MIKTRLYLLLGALVLAGALSLRLTGVRLGLPYQLLIDEPQHLVSALRMLSEGTLDHQNWTYPGLFPTLLAGVFALVRGALTLSWPPTNAEIPTYLLAGRVLVALAGTLTVALTIALARRATGSRAAALVAGALLAVSPLHVRQSQEMVVDAPAALFVVLGVLVALIALERGSVRWLALSAAACGAAAATKYNAGLAAVAPLCAALAGAREERPRRVAAVILATGLGFALATPLVVARVGQVRERLGFEFAHYAGGHLARRTDARAYGAYARLLGGELTLAGALAAGLGLLVLARRGAAGATLLAFPLLYYLYMGRFRVDFARTLAPLVPFLAVVAAAGLARIGERSRVLAAMLALGCALGGLSGTTAAEARLEAWASDVVAAKDFIEGALPEDSAVALEWHGPPLNEWPSARRFRARIQAFAVADGLDALARDGVRFVVESGQYELLDRNPDAHRPQDPRSRVLAEYARLRREGKILARIGTVRIWQIGL